MVPLADHESETFAGLAMDIFTLCGFVSNPP